MTTQEYEGRPWARQEGEDSKWYSRFFRYYLPQGPERTLEEAWRQWKAAESPTSTAKRPNSYWYESARRDDWVRRAEAYDAHERELQLERQRQEREDMRERHLNLIRGLQTAATKRLKEIMEKDWETLSPTEVRLLIRDTINLERQARGLPDLVLEALTMTDEQLIAAYQGLYAQMAGKDGEDDDAEA